MIRIRSYIKTRIYDGDKISYYKQRWDEAMTIMCTDIYDINDQLIFECDILKKDDNMLAIVSYGEPRFNNDLFNFGWHLTIYENNEDSFSRPMDIEMNREEISKLEVIGNIIENPELVPDIIINDFNQRLENMGVK